jgi:hypothetical protein
MDYDEVWYVSALSVWASLVLAVLSGVTLTLQQAEFKLH